MFSITLKHPPRILYRLTLQVMHGVHNKWRVSFILLSGLTFYLCVSIAAEDWELFSIMINITLTVYVSVLVGYIG